MSRYYILSEKYTTTVSNLIIVASAISCILYGLYNLFLFVSGAHIPAHVDFGAYYQAGLRAVQGYPLYELSSEFPELLETPGDDNMYLYPPIVSLVFVPFTEMPFNIASRIWVISQFILAAGGLTYLISSLRGNIPYWAIGVGALALLGFNPFTYSLQLGQITGLILGLLSVAAACLVKNYSSEMNRSDILIGVFLGLSGFMKPFLLPVAIVTVRRRRRFIAFIGTFGGLVILSLLLFSWHTHLEYLNAMVSTKASGQSYSPLHLLGPFKYPSIILLIVSVGILGVFERENDTWLFSAALSASLFVAVGVSAYSLALILPAILISFNQTSNGVTKIIPPVSFLLIHSHIEGMKILSPIIGPSSIFGIPLSEIILWIQPAAIGLALLLILSINNLNIRNTISRCCQMTSV